MDIQATLQEALITHELLDKIARWGTEEQIYLSAFFECLKESSFDLILSDSTCIIEDVRKSPLGTIEEMSFWMKLRMDYSRFVLRRSIEGPLVLGAR